MTGIGRDSTFSRSRNDCMGAGEAKGGRKIAEKPVVFYRKKP